MHRTLWWVLLLLTGCPAASEKTKAPPRPVTVLELAVSQPQTRLELTGSVASWKAEAIGFSIGGRLEWVAEAGQELRGRTRDEQGTPIHSGTVIARLDRRRHALALRSAEALARSLQARRLGIRMEIERVLPEEERGHASQLERAGKDLVRVRRLLKEGTARVSERDRLQAEVKLLQARIRRVHATRQAKEAEAQSVQAQLEQQREAIRRARLDLEDCDLVSPFDGQIAAVHAIPGAFLAPGQPVVQVVMMDPLAVEVMVSARTDREISYGDSVLVYPPDSNRAIQAIVNRKQVLADASTRTFKVSLLLRNRKVLTGKVGKGSNVFDMSRVETIVDGLPFPVVVDVKSIYRDAQGAHVWKAHDAVGTAKPQRRPQEFKVKRIPVTLQAERRSFLGYIFRRVDAQGLAVGDILLRGQLPMGLSQGDQVVFSRQRWRLRPGDLVRCAFEQATGVSGFHVPMESILPQGSGHVVYVVEGDAGALKAKAVQVTVGGGSGELKRIESADLKSGTRVVVQGARYLAAGQAVTIIPTPGR